MLNLNHMCDRHSKVTSAFNLFWTTIFSHIDWSYHSTLSLALLTVSKSTVLDVYCCAFIVFPLVRNAQKFLVCSNEQTTGSSSTSLVHSYWHSYRVITIGCVALTLNSLSEETRSWKSHTSVTLWTYLSSPLWIIGTKSNFCVTFRFARCTSVLLWSCAVKSSEHLSTISFAIWSASCHSFNYHRLINIFIFIVTKCYFI